MLQVGVGRRRQDVLVGAAAAPRQVVEAVELIEGEAHRELTALALRRRARGGWDRAMRFGRPRWGRMGDGRGGGHE